jgi:hypothetical protein
MRRLLLTAVSVTARADGSAAIPAELTRDAVAAESQTVPASATLAYFDSADQQLLQGGANP